MSTNTRLRHETKQRHYNTFFTGNKPNLAVCIKPLYNGFNRALNVGEFIEFYKLLGATHFVFYNLRVGDNMEIGEGFA